MCWKQQIKKISSDDAKEKKNVVRQKPVNNTYDIVYCQIINDYENSRFIVDNKFVRTAFFMQTLLTIAEALNFVRD